MLSWDRGVRNFVRFGGSGYNLEKGILFGENGLELKVRLSFYNSFTYDIIQV